MKHFLKNLRAYLEGVSNERSLLFPFFFFAVIASAVAQPGPVIDWQKKYGGPSFDNISAWAETNDGYLIGGSSLSGLGGDKSEPSRGESDYWVVKIDKSGLKQWDKTFGGANRDQLKVIITTSDGFLLCGVSNSGISGDKTQASRGKEDYWIVKISTTGAKIWDRTFGGSHNDQLEKGIKTLDNGFLLAGTSYSPLSGDKSEDIRNPFRESDSPKGDFWVIKINSSGTKVWDKTYGGQSPTSTTATYNSGDDQLTSLVAATDGGFLLGGYSNSLAGYEKSETSNSYDFWVLKINGSGTKLWDKTFGSDLPEVLTDIAAAPDGGFILGGYNDYIAYQEESYTNYASEVVLKKISETGSLQWENKYRPDVQISFYSMHMASYAFGFSVLFHYEGDEGQTLITYNWQGVIQYQKLLMLNYTVSMFQYNSTNEAFIGHNPADPADLELHSSQYGLVKFKAEPAAPAAEFTLNLYQHYLDETLHVEAVPTYFQEHISKVEFYINGIKKGEDTSFPFTFNWKEKPPGDHKVKAIATTSSGKKVFSKEVDWRIFQFYGRQAESGFFTAADPGKYSVREEKEPTLNGGSSVRLWDVGDRAKFELNLPKGKYVIKVHLRSGYSTPAASNSTSYWPSGYSFWVNGTRTPFVGDPKTIVEKKEAYGGSFWGTMVSSEVTFTKHSRHTLEIQANRQWGGIDYIEVILKSTERIEAELNYFALTDVGKRVIGEERYSTLSNGSSTKIWDAGDKVRIFFYPMPGNYIIKARVRTGYYNSTSSKPTNYWPNGYKFWLNNNPITLIGNLSSVEKDPSYGGSYWGTMESGVVRLEKELSQSLDVLANMEWCGIDYIELVPVEVASARLAQPEEVTAEKAAAQNSGVYPNPFNDIINVKLPASEKKVAITLVDVHGNVHLNESKELNSNASFEIDLSSVNLKSGLYLLKIKGEKGERVVRVSKN